MRHIIILFYAWLVELYRKPLMLSNSTIKLIYIPGVNKIRSFNCNVEKINGHNIKMIEKSLINKSNKPKVIIADTIKGKGVDFMENKILWHYKSPTKKQLDIALKILK